MEKHGKLHAHPLWLIICMNHKYEFSVVSTTDQGILETGEREATPTVIFQRKLSFDSEFYYQKSFSIIAKF